MTACAVKFVDGIAHVLGHPLIFVPNEKWIAAGRFRQRLEEPQRVTCSHIFPEHGHVHLVNGGGHDIERLGTRPPRPIVGKSSPEDLPVRMAKPLAQYRKELMS